MSTRNLADEELTQAVLSRFGDCSSERLQEVMQSLVRHLHAFASEVELTEEEWFAGIEFLTRTGHITDDRRQEFILLSDVLGLSMLVIGLNHRKPAAATPATVFGPFFVEGSPHFENGDDISNGAPGEPCLVQGRVVSLTGEPIAGAHLEIWQADDDGFYDVQYRELEDSRGRGNLTSADDGRFWFWTVKPVGYPIPGDGPVGDLLRASNRSPMRPAHVHFMVSAPGYETVTTHVFADGDPDLDTDAVFGVKSELIAPVVPHGPGRAPDGRELQDPYWSITYDIVLAPDAGDDDHWKGTTVALTTSLMTDEQRKSVALEYLKAFDNGGTTSTGGSILDLFADDAQVYFPKWGLASGKDEIGRMFGDVGATLVSIRHDYSHFNWVFSGSDVVVCEGTSHGEHRDGPWRAGLPEWQAGRWCDVFEIRDWKIQRCFIYLDPDYAGKDTARYPWLAEQT